MVKGLMMEEILKRIGTSIINNGIDWIITAVITYFSVKVATRRYYDATKRQVSEGIMVQGLRALLKLKYNENLPNDAQVIFVKYKGRSWNLRGKNKCKFMEKIRRTVAVAGGNTTGVSEYRPLDFGVLGVANKFSLPVLFDFQDGKLYKYERGRIFLVNTIEKEGCYYYERAAGEYMLLSEKETTRDIMIAIPLKALNKKIAGGLTFDLKIGSKTV